MLLDLDPQGIRLAQQALAEGQPVCLPPPSPITYGLAGTDPAALNRAKGRPEGQPVAAGIVHLAQVAGSLAVDPPVLNLVNWLVFDQSLTVLVPVDAGAADWLEPATVDGVALVAGAWLPKTLPIVHSVNHLYLTSGNPSGQDPSATASGADDLFDGQLLVIDGDHLRTPSVPHGATTTIAVTADGSLSLTRDGIQNIDFRSRGEDYLKGLRIRFVGKRGPG